MKVGEFYDVAYMNGRYDIDYLNGVKCIKITPKSYRVERPSDGKQFLIRQDGIMKLERVSPLK